MSGGNGFPPPSSNGFQPTPIGSRTDAQPQYGAIGLDGNNPPPAPSGESLFGGFKQFGGSKQYDSNGSPMLGMTANGPSFFNTYNGLDRNAQAAPRPINGRMPWETNTWQANTPSSAGNMGSPMMGMTANGPIPNKMATPMMGMTANGPPQQQQNYGGWNNQQMPPNFMQGLWSLFNGMR